jgi:hypothetical protein
MRERRRELEAAKAAEKRAAEAAEKRARPTVFAAKPMMFRRKK